MLVPRKPIELGKGLPTINKNWQELLENDEQIFLTDNQLSIYVDRKRAGLEKMHFYPLPFEHKFSSGRWDYEELAKHSGLTSTGPSLDIEGECTHLRFLPHIIEKEITSGATRVRERCAVSGNDSIIEWEITGVDTANLKFSLPDFAGQSEPIGDGLVVSVKDQVFLAIVVLGAGDVFFDTESEPFGCSAKLALTGVGKVSIALSCGYDKNAAIRSAQSAAKNPASVFQRAAAMWNDYFTKVVPYFSCSDRKIEQLFYCIMYVDRANLYDIPYEPFSHPYTCPWKTGAIWQWSWNTPMDAIYERWLNDKAIGAGGTLLIGDNGGGLNDGTFLRPLEKVTKLRDRNEYFEVIGQYLKQLPDKYDIAACSTLPHTTPNGLLGAWEFFLSTGDKEFLRSLLDIMIEAEGRFSENELDNGLSTANFIDEFDYSLRLRPFVSDFQKGDPVLAMKMDTPFIAVDYNCYLHSFRERIIDAAGILGASDVDVDTLRAKNSRLKDAINQFLWDDADGFYYDADPRDMSRSGVKCIAGFSALYAGIASEAQARRLVKHLADPAEFGTPYPCPSISMDTPDVDPSLITYGGDCLISSGIWFTVQGLVRYGYTDLAVQYILKTIEMMTKDGPSSSYSYHSITGRYNMDKNQLADQSGAVVDLICKYLIGINPKGDGAFEINPLALQASGVSQFRFGPYNCCGKWITVDWDNNSYQVVVNDKERL